MGSSPKKGRSKIYSTPEGREQYLTSLAIDQVEEQLLNGTASSAVLVHYLKLANNRQDLERQKMEREIELLEAKRDQIASAARSEELLERAIEAMRSYRPSDG